jgi:diacylglycerol kinase family enzyme
VTIEKGAAWGEPGTLPSDGITVASDREGSRLLEAARLERRPFPTLGLRGGDLCRTLGGPAQLATTFTIDAGEVLVDGRVHFFLAHVIAHNRTWSRAVAALNAQWRGGWNLAPRGHPNDGMLDVFEAALGVADRLKVRARLGSGTHLPHPGINQRRVPAVQFDLDRGMVVELDGEVLGTARAISVRVQPDALKVVV